MNDYKKLVTRRNLLQTFACIMIAPLQAEEKATTSRSPGTKADLFRIHALDRKYDLHRENGCTLLAIEVAGWPGNEFGLWLPETIYLLGKVIWGNWWDNAHQEFEQDAHGRDHQAFAGPFQGDVDADSGLESPMSVVSPHVSQHLRGDST